MNIHFEDFIDCCKEYNALGWAVQEQLDQLLYDVNSLSNGDLNDNAVSMIEDFAVSLPIEIADSSSLLSAIEYYRSLETEEDEDE